MLAWTLPSRDRGRPSVKCLAFSDRIIKLKDYLLEQAANKKPGYYLDEKQYNSIYADGEELVKILVARCKKLDDQLKEEKK